MPTPMDAMLGLVVTAIGLLTLVIAFNIPEPKKRILSYGIAGFVIFVGACYYVSSELRGPLMRRKMNEMLQRQQDNLDAIRKRLPENPAQAPDLTPAKR